MRDKHVRQKPNQREKIEQAMVRAGTLRDKIEAARRSANEVRELARGLKSELKETINLLNAIRRQMEETLTHTPLHPSGDAGRADINTDLHRSKGASVCDCQRRTVVTNP